jgi:hypothetical protein
MNGSAGIASLLAEIAREEQNAKRTLAEQEH